MLLAQLGLALLLAASAPEHFRRAQQFMDQQDWRRAEQEYLAGLALAPEAFEAHNNLGAIYFQQADYEHAAQSFGEAVRLRPANLEFRFNYGLSLFRLGRTEDALPHLEAATKSPQRAADAFFLSGLCHFHAKRWGDAAQLLESAKRKGKSEPEQLYLLIKTYQNAGMRKKQLLIFSELAGKYPESGFVHQLLAEAFDLSNNPAAAEKQARQAIEAEPRQPELHFALGYLLWKEKRYDEARSLFDQELQINPRSVAALYYLGDLALKRNEYDLALQLFQQVAAMEPTFHEVALGFGRTYAQLGNFEKAEEQLRRAVEFFPDSVPSHYQLGRLLLKTGRAEEGRRHLVLVEQLKQAEAERTRQAILQAQ